MADARNSTIRPFRIETPRAELDNLRDRVRRGRLPDAIPGVGSQVGDPRDHLAELEALGRAFPDLPLIRGLAQRTANIVRWTELVRATVTSRPWNSPTRSSATADGLLLKIDASSLSATSCVPTQFGQTRDAPDGDFVRTQ